jgi:gliding motility-associated-like protein
MKYLFYLIICICPLAAQAQLFSNKGNDFWLCFPRHTPGGTTDNPPIARMSVFITSDFATDGFISWPGVTQTWSITAGQVLEIDVPYNACHLNEIGTVVNKGIRVYNVGSGSGTVKKPFVVYAHQYAGLRSAATLVLPTTFAGRSYLTSNYLQNSTNSTLDGSASTSQFQIIATQPNTVVRVVPRISGVPQSPFNVTLPNVGDVYQYTASSDLTGSEIESQVGSDGICKVIAVFSGSSSTSIFNAGCSGAPSFDPLFQQCYPTTTWGKTFGLTPFASNNNGYHYRVLAAQNNTQISVNGTVVATINAGQFYLNSISPTATTAALYVTADKPISVAQYIMSRSCANSPTTNNGDPDMVILNPIEQNIKDVILFSSSRQNIAEQHLKVLIPTTATGSFTVNGAPSTTGFITLPGNPAFSYKNIPLPSGLASYRLQANQGFNAIAYGLGDAESYVYSGGTNFPTPYLSTKPTADADLEVCEKEKFELYTCLPYPDPSSIKFYFYGAFTDTTILNPPVVANFSINGEPFYAFKIPRLYNLDNSNTYRIDYVAKRNLTLECYKGDSVISDLKVWDLPTAAFTENYTQCLRDPVNFLGGGIPVDRPFNWFNWNFGNGGTSSIQNPMQLYNTPGTYQVSYQVGTGENSLAFCQSDSIKRIIKIDTLAEPFFTTSTPRCERQTISFFDNSRFKNINDTIKFWYWNFGDGTTLTKTNNSVTTHTYAVAGTYNVKLAVRTNRTCLSDTFTLPITVNATPNTRAILPDACLLDPFAQFTNATTISDASAMTYLWNFGNPMATPSNPNTSTLANPTHIYTNAGSYNIQLTATSNQGCSQRLDTQVVISGMPMANFAMQTPICSNRPAVLTNTSTIPVGRINQVIIQWDFLGDPTNQTIDNNPTPNKRYTNIYPSFGTPLTRTYRVRVTTRSGGVCINSIENNITVNAAPVVSFAALPRACRNDLPFTLTQGSEAFGLPGTASYFGTGITAPNLFNPSNAVLGSNLIGFTYRTTAGCTDTAYRTLQVNPNPTVNAGPDLFLIEGNTEPINAIVTGNVITYLWTPATGLNNAAVLRPLATPLITTTYNLLATTDSNCRASDNVKITVLKRIKIPNTFTPNNDGVNDVWELENIAEYPSINLQVFNRFGQIVYTSRGFYKPWNGQFKGTQGNLPFGTYYYVLNSGIRNEVYTGYVVIIR